MGGYARGQELRSRGESISGELAALTGALVEVSHWEAAISSSTRATRAAAQAVAGLSAGFCSSFQEVDVFAVVDALPATSVATVAIACADFWRVGSVFSAHEDYLGGGSPPLRKT